MSLLALALFADPAGLWHASVINSENQAVEFQFQLKQSGGRWTGALLNGADRTESSDGSFDGRTLRLEFKDWDGVLEAQVKGEAIDGTFVRTYRKTKITRVFHAQRKPFPRPSAPPGGNIAGEWLLNVDDKEKSVWRASFTQSGGDVRGVLIPVTGDSGEMAGTISGGRVRLGRFDAIRTMLLDARLTAAGTLEGTLNFNTPTWRITGRRAADVGGPDAAAYTRMKNPSEAFRFSYPDLDGVTVSNSDTRFHGKAVIVSITGSWCPNCHEEAPFLNELYQRFHSQGLEIVALAFEYTGDAERDRGQLRLFAKKYAVPYPILLAGTTEEGEAKLAQLEHFGAYPTTIFIGRDGLVKRIHAGFDGPSTGRRHEELRRETTRLVADLLRN